MQGHKETEGKLEYELDWDFIQAMAERMQLNKGKYEPNNWQKPMDVDKLKQALFRHTIDVMRGIYDDTTELDHLPAIACNAMMLWYQLKHYSQHTAELIDVDDDLEACYFDRQTD